MCIAHGGREWVLSTLRSVVLGECEPPGGLGFEPRYSGGAAQALNHRFICIRYFYIDQADELAAFLSVLWHSGITCTHHHTDKVQSLKPRQALFL